MRPDWDEYFGGVAYVVSMRASCPRAKVGAVIVSSDRRILGTGYNGAPSGEPDCLDDGCIMEDGHCQRALHAEVNAIGYAARHGVKVEGARIYIYDTMGRPPCRECAKVLRAAGVYYHGGD